MVSNNYYFATSLTRKEIMSNDQATKEDQTEQEQTPVDGYYSDEELGFDEDELDLSFLDDDEE